jgi:hypothetical protein
MRTRREHEIEGGTKKHGKEKVFSLIHSGISAQLRTGLRQWEGKSNMCKQHFHAMAYRVPIANSAQRISSVISWATINPHL